MRFQYDPHLSVWAKFCRTSGALWQRDGAVRFQSVRRDESPSRIAKGLANHPIGVILLARLAVDRAEQGSGLGKALLADALVRSAGAADVIGARAILVHAIDDEAAKFYRKYGFETSPLERRQMMLLMKDLRATLGSRKGK